MSNIYPTCSPSYIPYQDPSCNMAFVTPVLVSNSLDDCSRFFDINLLNPWGLLLTNDTVWVANESSGLLTSYDLVGRRLQIVSVFGPMGNIEHPTGLIRNCTNAFVLVRGPISAPSVLLMATREGTINGYNQDIWPNNSITVINNSDCHAVYTGLAIVGTTIYAADFYNQKIDVYDGEFCQVKTFPFVDEFSSDPIPEDYGPYNIVRMQDVLFVTYARQNELDNQYEVPVGGFISIFTFDGLFVRRFGSRGVLNAPWALLYAPSSFGYPSSAIMVGNYGDGVINIFGPNGQFLDQLKDEFCNIISFGNLRSLVPNPCCSRIIYWTASTCNLRTARMGTINSNLD